MNSFYPPVRLPSSVLAVRKSITTPCNLENKMFPSLDKSSLNRRRINIMSCSSHHNNVGRGAAYSFDKGAVAKNEEQHEKSSPRNLATNFFSTLYINILKPPTRPVVDPKLVLTGNYAPVDEMPPTECEVVKGILPQLNGVYMRNGPNPQHEPLGAHHLFEGDGMIHSIKLTDGKAIFCSRYIKTYKYNIEKKAGVPLIPNFFSGTNGIIDVFRNVKFLGNVLVGKINIREGFGLANTSVAFFFNKVFALVDSDLPYAITSTKEGDIETLGRYDFDGQVSLNMTAHPKIDPKTGEIFAFRCFPDFPYLTFFRFESNGLKQHDVPIYSMKTPTYVHDFGITKRYAIFPDTQIHMDAMSVMKCKGMPAYTELDKLPRIGILPRYATNDSSMKWFDVPGFNPFHILNAWEEGDGIDEDIIVIVAPNYLFIQHLFENMGMLRFSMEKLKIDMKNGIVSSRVMISEKSLELGSINSSCTGTKTRYAYVAVSDFEETTRHVFPRIVGVVKLDLELECEVGCRMYGQGCYGGEVYFVAREGSVSEDDGYVVSFVHDEMRGESRFLVMDATSMTLNSVAEVKLPGRVPYGFHGLFVAEKDL